MAVRIVLFLVSILLLLTSVANAYDYHEEDIWVFQGSYQLKVGERAELEGFTVKLHTISDDGNSATILIYRNSVFKEAYFIDTGANSEQIYADELMISVQGISTDRVSMEMHKHKTERVWITSTPKTALKNGDTIRDGAYVVKLKGLTDEGAEISMENEGNTVEGSYIMGDHEKIPDGFMMRVVYINKNTEEVFVETLRPGKPEMGIVVRTDKEGYYPNEDIGYQFSLSNDGSIPLHGLVLSTSASEGDIGDETLQHASLDPGKVKKFVTTVSPPLSPVAKNITISSDIRGYDYRGNEYSGTASIEVPVRPYISIEKEILVMKKSSYDREFGTDEYFLVSLTLRNMANFRTALTVSDDIPESFIPDNMEKPEWTILMEPDSEKTIEYHAKPTEPGNFTFGNAIVEWKHDGETYSMESPDDERFFQVHGLKVIAEKKIVSNYLYPGEETEVVVKITNTGNVPAEVHMSDSIPSDFELVGGMTEWKGKLDAGESKEIIYNIRALINGDSYLPAATVDFSDENKRSGTAVSGTPAIYVDEIPHVIDYEEYIDEAYQRKNEQTGVIPDTGAQEITRFGAAGFLVRSFVVLFCVIAIIPVTTYLFIRSKYNN